MYYVQKLYFEDEAEFCPRMDHAQSLLISTLDKLDDKIWDFWADDTQMKFWIFWIEAIMAWDLGECWDMMDIFRMGDEWESLGPEGRL